MERFEESECRTKPGTQKRQSDIKKKREKAQGMRKNAIGRFGGTKIRKEQDENDTGDKNKVEDVVQKLLVFFKKNLNKVANLDQKAF